jgi:tripartite-type tricarboxylate transporter receptor subunit TctC
MQAWTRMNLRLMSMLLAIAPAVANAQAWPTARPVSIIAPSSAGSTPDVLTRLLAQRLGEQLGQQFLVVNRVGAGGNLGSEAVAKAAPDGYTLLLGSIANTVNPHLIKGTNFSLDDFSFISSFAAAPDFLVTHPSMGANTLAEVIAALKAKPMTAMPIPGFGSTPHLSTVMFRTMAAVEINMVPYQGGGAVLQGLVGNQVPLGFLTSVSVISRIRSGQLKAIAVSSTKRLAAMPDVPTFAEAGLPGFEVTAWFGLFAPAKTPQSIVDRISEETRKALAHPELAKRLADLGAEPLGSTPEAFTTFVRAEYAKWGKLIRDAGIKVE